MNKDEMGGGATPGAFAGLLSWSYIPLLAQSLPYCLSQWRVVKLLLLCFCIFAALAAKDAGATPPAPGGGRGVGCDHLND